MKRILILLLGLCVGMCMVACKDKGKDKGKENSALETSQSQNGGVELPEDKFD